jgi:hypothetical protein
MRVSSSAGYITGYSHSKWYSFRGEGQKLVPTLGPELRAEFWDWFTDAEICQ